MSFKIGFYRGDNRLIELEDISMSFIHTKNKCLIISVFNE